MIAAPRQLPIKTSVTTAASTPTIILHTGRDDCALPGRVIRQAAPAVGKIIDGNLV